MPAYRAINRVIRAAASLQSSNWESKVFDYVAKSYRQQRTNSTYLLGINIFFSDIHTNTVRLSIGFSLSGDPPL